MQLNLHICGQGSSTALLDRLCLRVSSENCNQGVAWHCIQFKVWPRSSAFKITNFLEQFCFLQLFGPRTPSVCWVYCLEITLTLQLVIRIPVSCHGASSCCLLIKNGKRNSPKANGTTLCNITIILYWLEATHGTYQYSGEGMYYKGLIISRQG